MPKYRITAPTGETYEVTAPEGATQEQVMAYVQSQHQPTQPNPQAASEGQANADRVAAINDTLGGSALGLGAHALNYLEKYVDAHTGKDSTVRKVVDTVADNAIGAPVAAMHHAVNAPLGLVQLGAHALPGSAGASVDNFIKKREDAYQSGIPTNVGSVSGAAVGEIAPWVAGIGSARAAGYIPKANTTLQKLGLLAGEGAAMGAAQPVTDGGSFAGQKALQVGVGAGLGPLAYGTAKGAGALADAAKYITNPQAVADNVLAKQFGSTPDVVAKLRGAPQYVNGERVSVAQALQTPEAVKAERMLRNTPGAGPALAAQDDANNAARQEIVKRLAGTDEQMQAAIQARRDATQPWREANLPAEGSALTDPTDIIQTLEKLARSGNDTVRGAARKHLSLIREHMDQNGGRIPVTDLEDIRQGVGSTLASVPNNGAVTAKEIALYAPVSDQITNAIERVAPGYRNYLAAYAKHSEPINTMESVQKLLDPNAAGSLNASGDPQLAISRLRQVLRGDDKARYPMSDAARQELENVRESLLRRTVSDNKVAASGPGTAADIQGGSKLGNLVFGDPLGQKAGPLSRVVGTLGGSALGHMVAGPLGGYAGAAAGAMLPEAAQKVTGRIAARVGESAADSKKAADAIERALKRGDKNAAQKVLDRIMFGHDLQLPARNR